MKEISNKKTENNKIMQFLILLFVFFSAMPFLPQAIFNILHGGVANIVFQYDTSFLNINIRFFKDVLLLVFIFLAFFQDLKKLKKKDLFIYISIFLVVAYGTIISVYQNSSLEILQIGAGFRSLVLVLFCIKMTKYIDTKFIIKLVKFIYFIIGIEFFVILLQYYTVYKYYGISNPFSLRLLGTFGGYSVVGYLGLASFLFVFTTSRFHEIKYKKIFYLSCFIIAALSGTRSAIISILIIILFSFIHYVVFSLKSKKPIYLFMSFLCIFPIFAYLLMNEVSNLSQRGNLIQNQIQGGRIDFLTSFFNDNSMLTVLFGNGIGYGTNAGVNIFGKGNNSATVDGTITSLLNQYGLILMVVFLFFTLYLLINVLQSSKQKIIEITAIILVSLLMILTTNIFEQYFFFSLLYLSFYIIKSFPKMKESPV